MEMYVKKAAKAAGTLCAAAGVVSVAISGAALAVAVKSIKYAKDAVSSPISEKSSSEIEKNEALDNVVKVEDVETANDEVISDTSENTEKSEV